MRPVREPDRGHGVIVPVWLGVGRDARGCESGLEQVQGNEFGGVRDPFVVEYQAGFPGVDGPGVDVGTRTRREVVEDELLGGGHWYLCGRTAR